MLYREDLNLMKCPNHPDGIGCEDRIYLHSRCHIDKPLWVSYFDGILVVQCSQCDKVLAQIAVARKNEAHQN